MPLRERIWSEQVRTKSSLRGRGGGDVAAASRRGEGVAQPPSLPPPPPLPSSPRAARPRISFAALEYTIEFQSLLVPTCLYRSASRSS